MGLIDEMTLPDQAKVAELMALAPTIERSSSSSHR
jgi:hypothetical protein